MAEHAIADVFEICRAGREMIVPSGAITGDFGIHRGLPGGGGELAGLDCLQRGTDQFVVGQHRDLKAEHVGGLAGRISRQVRNFGQRLREGPSQRQDLLRPRAGVALRLLCGVQNRHDAFGDSRRGAPAE